MKLNNNKCSLIPMGSSMDLPKPETCDFKWLNKESDLENLLGVPVGDKFEDDLIWKNLLSKLIESIGHWAAQ
jgi:hypothetical protein